MQNTLDLDLPETVEFVNAAELSRYLRISRATVLRWRRTERLPRAVHATPNSTLWNSADIMAWHRAGRPINALVASSAGQEECEKALDNAVHDWQREVSEHERDFDADTSHLPESLREMIDQSQNFLMVCEAYTNCCRDFIKTFDSIALAERREQICRGDSDNTDDS